MTNALESIASLLKNFIEDNPVPPLHVGEVMSLWTALTAFQESRALYQAALNTTTDADLKHALENALEGSTRDYNRLKEILIQEGVPLPSINEDKPKSNPIDVPEGVKLTDDEIANLIGVKVAASITFCAQASSQSTRTDVGLTFFQIQVELMKYASVLKNLMKNRGWLKTPPSYLPPGTPHKRQE
ncbi:DUF3231 family protein [Priestia abyssalis]|uniref:DUF3231 family protein n=1 Tax=Priestia abyssalis TaxID=1221450 RepID=UPI000994C8E3|nr:DUF3231 family protein [Priestia abyssalis]